MPFTIESILPPNQKLVSVKVDDSVQEALKNMIEYDFSQLLVVDHQGKLKGLITSDSIVKALSFCKTTVDKIQVSHAIVQVKPYKLGDGLSDLFNSLKDVSAIPVIDEQELPTAIITSYDTAGFFRTKAEDIFLAEDVELTLKDFIESSYKNSDGDLDEDALHNAIMEITPSGEELKKKFKGAINQYLNQSGQSSQGLNEHLLDSVFQKHLFQEAPAKSFSDLTLFEYIQLFKNVWKHYEESFNNISWESVNAILDSTRDARNALAHFREISAQEREILKYCASFLDRHRPSLSALQVEALQATSSNLYIPTIDISGEGTVTTNQLLIDETSTTYSEDPSFPKLEPPIEAISSSESRYARLADWLQNQMHNKVILSFENIESIIEGTLPPSARKHRSWWANDSVSHSQSQQWIEAGWRASSVNMSEERAVFTRIDERQAAYINFFSELSPRLASIPNLSIKPFTNPQGRHWFAFEISSDDYPSNVYALSFARGSRLRLELFIDVGNRSHNNRIFSYLQVFQAKIEADFGAPLSWEGLMGKQGARVAVYRAFSSVTDSHENWKDMQNWVVETLPRFYKALSKSFIEAIQATQTAATPPS